MAKKEDIGEPKMQATEHAKIRSLKERIAHLRRLMFAVFVAGALTGFVAFFLVSYTIESIAGPVPSDPVPSSIMISALVFLPFLVATYFFHVQVNRHVERLSKSEEPPQGGD